MGRRPRTPHFITGLGDGNVHDHPQVRVQDLNQRNPNLHIRRTPVLPGHLTRAPFLRESEAFSNSGDGIPHPISNGGPWQITAMGFLAVLGILVAVFLHLVTDSSPQRKAAYRRHARPLPPTKKKKTDAWSDDELEDQAYRADSEDVQQAGKLYPFAPRYGNVPPEHRHRSGTLTHRSYYHPEPVGQPSYRSPQSARHHGPERSPVPTGAGVTPARAKRPTEPELTPLRVPVGSLGLEGFQPLGDGDPSSKSPWAPSLHARPLSPASSFNSLDKSDENNSIEKGDEEMGTPRRGPSPKPPPLEHPSSRLLTPGSDDVTPHRTNIRPIYKIPVDEQAGHSDVQSPPLLSSSVPPNRSAPQNAQKAATGPTFPYIPILEAPTHPDGHIPKPPPPPESILIEKLNLVKMESGAPWELTTESQSAAYPGRIRHPAMEQPPKPNFAASGRSQRLPRSSAASTETTAASDTAEPRKNIIHKRTNMTACTDAESSLLTSVDFVEVCLESVIGGGGFGEVWQGTWRSTPVAVKVLTGSAQRENVSKAILEEFAAEINMLKGMRHPNICLYMGACFDPPNRCIITELAANGSLWDALRLPLSPIFQVSDGITHAAWPAVLYARPPGGPPTLHMTRPPPVVPRGIWPWALVKRVACGAARGMTYLHSGRPPVLHRDLKSANILLDESYTAKVCDFGLSRIKAQERSMTGNCGTVQWMAPEVLANQPYAEPADVFSFGIIMWEMLTGECPYDGMSAIQCALAVLNRELRPPIPEWCPSPLSALIRSCVDNNPATRPTFAQILLALDAMP